MSKMSVTIGIPALNEERSIGQLIDSLLSQREQDFTLDKIVVMSDGSSDNTVSIVRSISNPLVEVVDGHDRLGKAVRLNEVISACESDILVFLDADIKIDSDEFLYSLVYPILEDTADFTSGTIKPLEPVGIVDGVLAHIMKVKSYVYGLINNGDSVYSCFGPARAFNKKAYSQLHFMKVAGEDAFSYLQMKAKGMRFGSVLKAEFFVRVPLTLADHRKQSVRFLNCGNDLKKAFGKERVSEAYAIPFSICLKGIFYALRKSFIYSCFYVMILIYMKIQSMFEKRSQFLWEAPVTSKSV